MKKHRLLLFVLNFPMMLSAQWVQTNLNPGIGYCLFADSTTLYAGTDQGLYYTNDIGDPWFSIGPQDLIFSVITSGSNIVAGSGTGKGIWISSDMGENWSQASGMDQQSVYTLNKKDNYLFAGSWAGGVFRSGDNGSTWEKVGLDDEPVEAIFSLGEIIFAGGMDSQGGKVFFSINNGITWDYRYLPWPVSRIYCFAYQAGKVFAGTDGGLYSSDNAGDSWSLEYGAVFDSAQNVIDIKMFKSLAVYEQYLIASIMFNSIWISYDNGKEWVRFNEGIISDWTFYGLAVKDSNLWSLRDAFGNAYRRPLTDLVTGFQTDITILPDQNVLSQNYPNPFNPVTMINYQLPITNYVDLSIYNMLGQKVATLVSEKQPAGTYRVHWNATGYSSGIYYYTLNAGEFRDVKKMILIK